MDRVDKLINSMEFLTFDNDEPELWPVAMPPFEHQRKTLVQSKDEPAWGLWFDMGGGKTKVVLDNAFYLHHRGEIDCLIVIAPNGVYANWTLRELPKHKPEGFKAKRLAWPKNYKVKKQSKRLDEFLKPYDGLRVFAINIEALSRSGSAAYRYLCRLIKDCKGRVMLAVDESSAIKNIKAQRTKNVLRLREAVKYRRVLSGTPITQSPLDVFPQLHFLDPKIHGARNYYAFEGRYAIKEKQFYGDRSFDAVVGYRELDDLRRRMSSHGSFFDKSNMDLPDKVYMPPRNVELTAEQKKAYDNMLDFYRHETESGEEVTASTAMVRLMRLQQILLGWVYTEDGAEVAISHNRMAELDQVLEEAGEQQSIIWSTFRGPLNELREHFGKDAVYFFGGVSDAERAEAIDRFQAGDVQYFVANQMSAGHGLTLTAASNIVYYNNSFNLEQRLQSEDRAHRHGQTRSVTYTDLVAKDTVEEGVAMALQNKILTGSMVLDTYKKLIRT